MKIYALKIKIFLLRDLPQQEAAMAIATMIDRALCKESRWEKLHKQNTFKPYSFSSLSPTEKDGKYKAEKIYSFTLRCLDVELAEYLMNKLPNESTSELKGLTIETWIVPKKHITKLYSLTPVIVKNKENQYWRDEMSFDELQARVKTNLIKKFNYFENAKIDEDFMTWTLLEITNRKPIAVPYKGIKLLADKMEFQVADNAVAQDLAYMALATGIGEMGSRGAGYVNYHTMKGVK